MSDKIIATDGIDEMAVESMAGLPTDTVVVGVGSFAATGESVPNILDVGVRGDVPSTEHKVTKTESTAPKKSKRRNKNATVNKINYRDVTSVIAFLDEFYTISSLNPPTKGFDSHVNNEGLVWAGTAQRMPTSGLVNIFAVSIDEIVKRSISEDAEDATEAKEALDFMIEFLKTHRERVKAAAEQKIIDAAEAIKKSKEILL